jgi:hypothetical protein
MIPKKSASQHLHLVAVSLWYQPLYKNFFVAKSGQKKRVPSVKSYKLFGDAERERVDQRRFSWKCFWIARSFDV